MAFNIENGTAGILEINDLGITLGIGEISDLSTRTEPQNVALSMKPGQELYALITIGDVIVKDPLDGVTNLSVADAIVCFQSINDPHFRVGAGALIGDISDVTLTAPAANEILKFNGSTWQNAPLTSSGSLDVVATFAGLPGSPVLDDLVLYRPTATVLRWDGSDWVGPLITIPLFGRNGTGNKDVWLNGIGASDANPTGPPGNLTHGYLFPNIDTTSINSWKIYNLTVSTSDVVTGDLELHINASDLNPTFGTTGVVKATMAAQRTLSINVNTAAFPITSQMQCYWRHTSGTWADWTVTITYGFAAGP